MDVFLMYIAENNHFLENRGEFLSFSLDFGDDDFGNRS